MSVWNVANIENWNRVTFPDNTEQKQYKRVKGEWQEYVEAGTREEKLKELADVYIAFAGLSRFTGLGSFVCFIMSQISGFEELQRYVNEKMDLNTVRKWDEQMHHIEEDETEEIEPKKKNKKPEKITVSKNFNQWVKDGENWVCKNEVVTFTILKNEWESEAK